MTYISETVRHEIRARAGGKCEYCLLDERYTIKRHEVDHIFALKHGGVNTADNMCLCCVNCNRYKGSDLSSLDPVTNEVITLYHPRRDEWSTHFRLNGAVIEGITPTGRVTVKLLNINDLERLTEREALLKIGRYP
jgi:hypothetical protein